MSQSAKNQKSWSPWHTRLHKRLKKDESLLPNKSTLLLAVSGGQDSMALLKLIFDLRRLYDWHIEVWHGDHQWHNDSNRFAEELKNWCNKNKINFHSIQAQKEEVSNENKARNWRYKNLRSRAKFLSSNNLKYPCKRVLTGHTATDRAETILMNLARGTDLMGLSTLKENRELEKNINLVRPLIGFSRNETREICNEFNLPIWMDPSNANLNLTRNKVREKVLPVLNSIHKGADLRIAALANRFENYSKDEIIFATIALGDCKEEEESLSRKKIINFPNSVRKILLATWLKQRGVNKFTALQIEELNYKISIKKPPGQCNLHGGFIVSWNKKTIKVELEKKN